MDKLKSHISQGGYIVIDTPINVDSNSRNSDWIKMDAVDMGLNTKEKLLAWLKRKEITLEFYKTTREWLWLVEAYPYAKELRDARGPETDPVDKALPHNTGGMILFKSSLP